MTNRPASWRMPTPRQMEKLAAAAVDWQACATRPVGPADEMPPEYWQAVLADAVEPRRSRCPDAAEPNSSTYSEGGLPPLRQDRRDPEGGRRPALRSGRDLEGCRSAPARQHLHA